MDYFILFLYSLIAYGIGSIPFALVSSWIFKLPDPRTFGSKNPGATNVLRSGHKLAAFVTFFGDMVKGFLVAYFLPDFTAIIESILENYKINLQLPNYETITFVTIISVFLGHLFSVFLKFKGGKGIATAIGIYCGIHFGLGGLALWVWLTVLAIFRFSSLSGIVMSLVVPIVSISFQINMMTNLALVMMTIFILYRHASNIENILAGKETKVGQKK